VALLTPRFDLAQGAAEKFLVLDTETRLKVEWIVSFPVDLAAPLSLW
jgi:hypothetical protein